MFGKKKNKQPDFLTEEKKNKTVEEEVPTPEKKKSGNILARFLLWLIGLLFPFLRKQPKESTPRTNRDSIPFKYVYENGIVEVKTHVFSKSYLLPDANFKNEDDEEQNRIGKIYAEFLTSFDGGTDIEITMYNDVIDVEAYRKQNCIAMRGDSRDVFRDEYNRIMLKKMEEGNNSLKTMKVMTISIQAIDIAEAADKFIQIDTAVFDNILNMTRQECKPMSTVERISLLNRIYNRHAPESINQTVTVAGQKMETFSLANLKKQGIYVKDLIAPSMAFMTNHAEIDDYIVKSYYVAYYDSAFWLRSTILTDFEQIPTKMLASVHFCPWEQAKALRYLRNQNVNITSSIMENQKKASRSGYSTELVSPDLQDARYEAGEVLDIITKDNGKAFDVTLVITLFCDSEEQLKSCEKQLRLIAARNQVMIKGLNYQQEVAFTNALPLGNKVLYADRMMTTHSLYSIIPFNSREIVQEGGMYIGQNSETRNLIMYNRSADINPNAAILGMPGAGKTFASKRMIFNIILNSDDDVFVIDPEREYTAMAEALGGQVVKIDYTSKEYINPMDINIENDDESGDAVKIKTDFIESICEIMLGSQYGLSPLEKSIIAQSVSEVYKDHVQHLKRSGRSSDPEKAPTLEDLYNNLNAQPYPEAINMAITMQRFVNGPQDLFSHRTTVDTKNHFVVYDIKDIGSSLKGLGLQICLDNIWNKMLYNFAHGRRTYIFVDEFHILMNKPSAAEYISQIWKRARKWNGVPTAITQNVEDMLKNEYARTVINNSNFVIILGQTPVNRQQLSELFGLNSYEQDHISSAKPGVGLAKIGDNIIPFDDSFPRDTEMYKLMTTKPEERLEQMRRMGKEI